MLVPSSPHAVPLCLLACRGSPHPDESLSSRHPSEMPYIIAVVILSAAALPLRRPVPAAVPGPRLAGTAADRPGRKRGAAAAAGIPGAGCGFPRRRSAPLPKIPDGTAARTPPPQPALVQAVPGSGRPRARLRPPSLEPPRCSWAGRRFCGAAGGTGRGGGGCLGLIAPAAPERFMQGPP